MDAKSAIFKIKEEREKLQKDEWALRKDIMRIRGDIDKIDKKLDRHTPPLWDTCDLELLSLEELFIIQTKIEGRIAMTISPCRILWKRDLTEFFLKKELIKLYESFRCRYCKVLGHSKSSCPKLYRKEFFKKSQEALEMKKEEKKKLREEIEKEVKIPQSLAFERIQQEDCSICLQPFDQTHTIKVLSCFHYYHESCYDTYVETWGKSSCPICRQG